jgi:hypothetical protein
MTTTTTTAGELELAGRRRQVAGRWRQVAELYATVRQTPLPLGPAGVDPGRPRSGPRG